MLKKFRLELGGRKYLMNNILRNWVI